jgi:protein phosphatase PTC1
LVRNLQDPNAAAKLLVDHALARFSTDNLSCMIIRFDKQGLLDHQTNKGENAIGVEGDPASSAEGKISEVEKIVSETKAKIADGNASAVGVSASNSGKGHDLVAPVGSTNEDRTATATELGSVVEEEPETVGAEAKGKDESVIIDGVNGEGAEVPASAGGNVDDPPPSSTKSSA